MEKQNKMSEAEIQKYNQLCEKLDKMNREMDKFGIKYGTKYNYTQMHEIHFMLVGFEKEGLDGYKQSKQFINKYESQSLKLAHQIKKLAKKYTLKPEEKVYDFDGYKNDMRKAASGVKFYYSKGNKTFKENLAEEGSHYLMDNEYPEDETELDHMRGSEEDYKL